MIPWLAVFILWVSIAFYLSRTTQATVILALLWPIVSVLLMIRATVIVMKEIADEFKDYND